MRQTKSCEEIMWPAKNVVKAKKKVEIKLYRYTGKLENSHIRYAVVEPAHNRLFCFY